MSEKFFLHNLHFKTNVNKNFQNRYFGGKQKLFFTDKLLGIATGQKQLKRALLFTRLIVMVDFYRNHSEGFF